MAVRVGVPMAVRVGVPMAVRVGVPMRVRAVVRVLVHKPRPVAVSLASERLVCARAHHPTG